jgi:ABC-type transport system involved in multi-copper enzyme maturation permease subunit
MSKVWLIAKRLLWQNRWLFLLLMLWPYGMAALLLAGGKPDPDDVLWMLHQECFAGLALVAVTGSTLLGNEQRSRRIVTVLSRAVSRPMYLFSLLLAAWIPLALYASGFLISGVVLVRAIHQSWGGVLVMLLLQLALGVWAGAISIFWSVLLPQLIASLVSIACIALAAYAGILSLPGPSRLLASLFQTTVSGANAPKTMWLDIVITLAAGAVWLAAASWIFSRRDLNLAAD